MLTAPPSSCYLWKKSTPCFPRDRSLKCRAAENICCAGLFWAGFGLTSITISGCLVVVINVLECLANRYRILNLDNALVKCLLVLRDTRKHMMGVVYCI
ncbi:hypothetical protein BDV12DRAFT_49136 [Aspergillus spectabilis]